MKLFKIFIISCMILLLINHAACSGRRRGRGKSSNPNVSIAKRPMQSSLSGSKNAEKGETFESKYLQLCAKFLPFTSIRDKFKVSVSRENIFEDSLNAINGLSKIRLARGMAFIFKEDTANNPIGLGGNKIWFSMISAEMINPELKLFKIYNFKDDKYAELDINSTDPSFEFKFEFVGKVIAMAIFHTKLLSVCFTVPFLKSILNKTIKVEDVRSTYPELHTEISNPKPGSKFVLEGHKLKENGTDIPVTTSNKRDFIRLALDWLYKDRVRNQLNYVASGFHSIFPDQYFKNFTAEEVGKILCGTQFTKNDLADFRRLVQYTNYQDTSATIDSFFHVIAEFDNIKLAKLLMFITGAPRLPVQGFAALKIRITKHEISDTPTSKISNNNLFLPPYETDKEMMKEKLDAVILKYVKLPFVFE